MTEPCGLSGPCGEMKRLLGEGCFYERGKMFLGSMRLLNCPDCHADLPDIVLEAWDKQKRFFRPITPVQLPEPPAWREDDDI